MLPNFAISFRNLNKVQNLEVEISTFDIRDFVTHLIY